MQQVHNLLKNDLTLNSTEEVLKELIEIDSQIANHRGISLVQEFVAHKLKDLGFHFKWISNSLMDTPKLLHASLIKSPHFPSITFIAHSDVVTHLEDNPFRVDGKRIYGAGSADDKGGIAVCLSTLKSLLQTKEKNKFNINVIISPNEETGSLGFHDYFKEVGTQSDYVLGLEPALHTGNIISSRSGNRWYNVEVKGLAAHAGRFSQPHINAAHSLCLLISQLQVLNCEKSLRRLNVGSIQGGNGGFNTICDNAFAKLDARFSNLECREMIHQKLLEAIENSNLQCPYTSLKSETQFTIEDDCPPLSQNKRNNQEVNFLLNLISKIEGRKIFSEHSGGAADINYFSSSKGLLIDGLGPIGGGMHTTHEYIERESLITRSRSIELFLKRIQGE
ncbi:putative peptidase [Halobacteriovorax marinus SJ]|uniref:Peptidase n=1 Tax=Halobacteriovorax marinus (strain ATCC BAA-682 / DSM 15412 / SJ) TaxID=862908 RepID=E1WX42_HALMS|nr:M20/M25/M40 family metallo-hydrolase [Halobacteriovorax marinus]CBW25743.1 putative peptidase [Halobacteriovorax marinus SJ]